MSRSIFLIAALFAMLAYSMPIHADEIESARTKSIHFEDGVVEGVSKTKGNLGTLITKDKDVKRNHLYDKRIAFDAEQSEAIREFRYLP